MTCNPQTTLPGNRPGRSAAHCGVLLATWLGASVHAAAPVPATDCIAVNRRQAAGLESQCYALEIAGQRRTFRAYVPASRSRPLPVILVLHGGGGSGAGMEWLTQRGFNRIADRDGALIVYPDGIGKGWNDGRSDLKSVAVRKHVDDLAFLRALPHELAVLAPIDSRRLYSTGISNGGLMSYRLACDAADIFAAVAPVAANLSTELARRCQPARPIAIAILEGTDDPIMPWSGGAIRVLLSTRGTVLSTGATAARWLELDKCSAFDKPQLTDAVKSDGTAIAEYRAHCAGSAEVVLDEIRGGGHTWPGGVLYLPELLIGRVSRELDADEAVWRFFQQHALP